MAHLSLVGLPPDLLTGILGALPAASLARMLRVSHGIRSAANDPHLWRLLCKTLWRDDAFEGGPPAGPERYGLRVHLFRRVCVCATGMERSERAAARAAVREMGGVWDDTLTTATTHLLCSASFSKKALIAAESRGRIALVSPRWLWESARLARRQPVHDHNVRASYYSEPLSSVQ